MSLNSKWSIGFLLVAESLFLATTFTTWLAVVSVCAFAIGVVLLRHRGQVSVERPSKRTIPRWLSWIVLSVSFLGVIAITAAWRLPNEITESTNPIFVATDILAHTALFSSLLIWMLRPIRGHLSMLPLGLVLMLLCVAAGGASRSVAAQTTVALAACFGFSLGSQIILGANRGTGGVRSEMDGPSGAKNRVDGRAAWMGPILSLLALSVLLMATSAIASATSLVLPQVQQNLHKQLQDSLNAVSDDTFLGGTRYVRGSRLGSIRKHMLSEPTAVALRVYGDYSPGYLRGHAFDMYRRHRWIAAGTGDANRFEAVKHSYVAPTETGSVTLQNPLREPLNRFPLAKSNDARTVDLEVNNVPLKGPVVFLPLTTRWIEAQSSELVVSHHGTVLLGVDVRKPYVAGVGLSPVKEELEPPRRRVLLDVPSSVATETAEIADEVCKPQRTARDKSAALAKYFQRGYSYSMNRTKAPKEVDPIAHFLRTQHSAHCEYFATATVLILRSAGIPTRYVTGYVADELDVENSVWVARNRDAHAWAEAYDDSTREWFPVESTPGRTYQSVDPDAAADEGEGFFDALLNDDGNDESMLGRAVGWLLSIRAGDPILLLFRIAQLPLFCVLVFLLWTKYLKPSRSRVDPIDLQSRKMLRKVDRRLRRYALVRDPSETLYQFANRIEQTRRRDSDKQNRRLAGFASWFRQYADARYQGALPKPMG